MVLYSPLPDIPTHSGSAVHVVLCESCGSMVLDRDQHTGWHIAITALARTVKA